MKTTKFRAFNVVLIVALAFSPGDVRPAGAGRRYGQPDHLRQHLHSGFSTPFGSSGTSSTVPTGWEFFETGTNANTTYRAGTGSDNAGDTYSFGASGNSERAFGGLLSGSLVPLIGAQFTNNTGGTITSLNIAYTGEQWRVGLVNRNAADRLDFQLSTNATSLNSGTWTDHDSLDFNGPVVNAPSIGALDGNAAANRTLLSSTITGLNVANGSEFLDPLGRFQHY